ncbi:MAG: class I tRNA ligase family protein [Candidatus Brennerbacteria bacterium]|nr:class I tRNA ligase family protein [Candidatus Brennerbacteria bacterium]
MFRNLKEFSLPAVEEKVLAYWRANRVFEASLAKTAKGKQFVFYEGPPTANGRPGIHHVLARAFKDIIPRYKTMRGFHVPRRGGWDTHGLPVEIEVEKALGLKSKKEIEKFGIAAFNAQCKESVWKYKDEWERLTERMGFWLDMNHPYITYENRYMEAVWGILKKVWEKKLLYRGHKVVPWCPRCGTGLSSHELALGYETVEDTSVYVKFKLKVNNEKRGVTQIGNREYKDIYILSWTTTPWTLSGNVALAVGKDIEYAITERGKETWIVAESSPLGKELGHISLVRGEELVGLEYEPLFDVPSLRSKTSYQVYPADFVTTEDGTGVVHTAVMYGEEDYQLGVKVGLPMRHTVDEAGKFTKEVKGFEGMFVKAPETEKKIIDYLQTTHHLLRTEPYSHEYPFCWRCQTPLLYYARDSWFIAMSKLRDELLRENKKINWVPAHLRDGRFGEWLREVKDWAISRARYWGTPLPIWECEKCEAREVIGSMEELQTRAAAGNRFIFMRHGEADHNVLNLCGTYEDTRLFTSRLTKKGAVTVRKTAMAMRKEKVDYIVTSQLARAKETAAILKEVLGGTIVVESGLREMNSGNFAGKPVEDFFKLFKSKREMFAKNPHGGETWDDVRKRAWGAFRSLNRRYKGKIIVVVGHGDPLWILKGALEGVTNDEQLTLPYPKTGVRYGVRTGALPRDAEGRVDLHRPYVDDLALACEKCEGTMKRVPEVLDVWFDSGAMPFAANKSFTAQFKIEKLKDYPADYISEGVDQTRGWFYTLHAIGALMGKGRAYKNVISLGLVLDKNGQKMSKSKGNTVDPWAMIQKYGIDAVRWYLYTVNPAGEPKKFDEAEIGKTLRQFLMMVYNSWLFYKTYALKNPNSKIQMPKSSNVLDKWVIARLEEAKDAATESLESYEVGDAARAIEAFAGNLSRWYIRCSRRRFQPARIATQSVAGGKPDPSADGEKDYHAASGTLGYVLLELTKLMAPFTPFFAEALYLSLAPNKKGAVESVHLEGWPKIDSKIKIKNQKLLEAMEEVRRLASKGLAIRAEKGIKVRQPLASLKLKTNNLQLKTSKEFLAILADEVNVKKVVVDTKLKEELVLDTNITHELLEEGWFRELVRTVQGMRQDAKLTPKDTITVYCEAGEELTHVLRAREKKFKREVNAKSVEFSKNHKHNVELQTKIGNFPAWFAVRKNGSR